MAQSGLPLPEKLGTPGENKLVHPGGRRVSESPRREQMTGRCMQVSAGASVRVCGLNFMGARDGGAIYGEANSAITISSSSFTDNARESPLRVEALCTPCSIRAQT